MRRFLNAITICRVFGNSQDRAIVAGGMKKHSLKGRSLHLAHRLGTGLAVMREVVDTVVRATYRLADFATCYASPSRLCWQPVRRVSPRPTDLC